MTIDGIRAAAAAAATPAAARSRVPAGGFSTALDRHLEVPLAQVEQVRAEVAALRGGGALARAMMASTDEGALSVDGFTAMPGWLDAELARQSTGDAEDPYGWRALSRTTAEQIIGPGFGALFERQIAQESGFIPEVVYGARVSSAGAEGIAQLMPQYYPNVDRRDPAASLVAGAQTMRDNLGAWGGDVRKAVASYNAGLGRIRFAVEMHGDQWEASLPQETKDYLAAILGDAAPRYLPSQALVLDPGRAALGVLAP